jgi:phage-related protein
MKSLIWLASSRDDLRAFPDVARQRLGYQLRIVQGGGRPDDFKPFATVGVGVNEIRVRVDGQWRLIYVAKFDEAVYVLHCFQKKTPQTSKTDVDIARQRYRDLIRERQHG